MSCDPVVLLGMLHVVAGAYALVLFLGMYLMTLFARLTYDGIFIFVFRRCRTWRRFDRAMRKIFS